MRDLTARTARINMADLVETDESDRLDRYARAWAAYDGEGPLPFADEDGQADDNIRLDYAKLIVDKGVSFLAGKGGVGFQIDGPEDEPIEGDEEAEPEAEPLPPEPPAPTGDPEADIVARREYDAAQQQQRIVEAEARQAREAAEAEAAAALDDAWPEEQRALDFHKLALNGGVCGHAWLRLHESGRVSVLDPSNVTVEWHEDDHELVLRYLIEWNTVDRQTGMGVARRKRIEPDGFLDENGDVPDPEAEITSWTIYTEEYDEDTGEWEEIAEPTPWTHSYAPMIGAQNLPAANTYYGNADLECATLDMIEQLESLASDMRRICRLHGHPIPVVIGEDANRLREIDVAIGALLAIPNEKASLGQLAIAELTSLLENYRELKTALFETVRIPKVALGETTGAGPSTGVALQVEYEPLIEKTETKRLTYGILLRQVAEHILDLRGYEGWRVTLGWPQLLPADEATEATTAEADLRMGIVSKQTIAEKRGYDWAVERARLEEERVSTPVDDPSRLLEQLQLQTETEPAPAE